MPDTLLNTTQFEETIYDIAVYNQILFVARQTGLYLSMDGGENWDNAYRSWMPDQEIPTLAVSFSPNFERDQLVFAGINGGIVLSKDKGETWDIHQFRNPPPMITSIAMSPGLETDRTILAGTYEDGMFRSTDAGQTWQAFNFGLFDHNILCITVSPNFVENQTVFVGTSSGIYKSTNGGRLWHDLDFPIGYDAILSLNVSNEGSIYAGTESNGLFKSEDNGDTWSAIIETESAINSIIATSNKLIVQINDEVVTSDDQGITWTTVISSDVNVIILARDKQSLVAGLADTSIQMISLSNP